MSKSLSTSSSLLVLLLAVSCASKALGAWQNEWIAVQKPFAEASDLNTANGANGQNDIKRTKEMATKVEMQPFYHPIVWDERFAPVCQLIVETSSAVRHCTCAFVKANWIATAAHCFEGISVPSTVAYVMREYGKEKAASFSGHTKNVLVEWWHAVRSSDAQADRDVAFAKTKKPSPHWYTLTERTNSIRYSVDKTSNLMAIGYPVNYSNYEQAVYLTGNVQKTTVVGTYEIKSDIPPATANQDIMGEGASGGPWLVSPQDLKIFENSKDIYDKLKLAQFAISSRGTNVGVASAEQRVRGVEVTANLLKAFEEISGSGGTMAIGASVQKNSDGSKKVTFSSF